jgi:hypothetical protein
MLDLYEALAWAALEGALKREQAIASFWEAEAARNRADFIDGTGVSGKMFERWPGGVGGDSIETDSTTPMIVWWHGHRRTR